MGSENNMVAVPKMKRQYPDYVDDPDGLARFRAEVERHSGHDMAATVNYNALGRLIDTIERLRAERDAARLASPQPDAQQGEAYRGYQAAVSAIRMWADAYEASAAKRLRAVAADLERGRDEVLATPPSPALDAATIERMADAIGRRVAERNGGLGVNGSVYAAAVVGAREALALPNAENRHG